jgi:hypothetical protein
VDAQIATVILSSVSPDGEIGLEDIVDLAEVERGAVGEEEGEPVGLLLALIEKISQAYVEEGAVEGHLPRAADQLDDHGSPS